MISPKSPVGLEIPRFAGNSASCSDDASRNSEKLGGATTNLIVVVAAGSYMVQGGLRWIFLEMFDRALNVFD